MNESVKALAADCAAIMIAAIAVGMAVNLAHPRGYDLVRKGSTPGSRVVIIGVDEARLKHQSTAVRFIDARDPEEYRTGRIPGALNIPAQYGKLPSLDDESSPLGPGAEPVLYCDGPECGSAEKLAARIIDAGYRRHVYILREGYPGWIAAGQPIERGEER